jgi:hypothetical protein
MRFYCLPFIVIFFSSLVGIGQTSGSAEEELYQSEIVWGVNKNSNGGLIGAVFLKYSWRNNNQWLKSLGLEVANVKHPQETKQGLASGSSFIFGKTNYLYAIRPSFGVERILSKKEPQQGIQISVIASGGPTLGIHAPYYLEVRESAGNNQFYFITRQARAIESNVSSTGRPLQGIFESDIIPGIHLRTGLSFEYGSFRSNVSGIEIGAMLEAYTKRVILMPLASEPNRSFFPSVYAAIYFGSRR